MVAIDFLFRWRLVVVVVASLLLSLSLAEDDDGGGWQTGWSAAAEDRQADAGTVVYRQVLSPDTLLFSWSVNYDAREIDVRISFKPPANHFKGLFATLVACT